MFDTYRELAPTVDPADLNVDGFECVEVVASLTEFHMETRSHTMRVGRTAAAVAAAMGRCEAFVATIAHAAVLHDIGMVGISRRVLLKPGALTEDEREHVMRHVEIGRQLLVGKRSSVLTLAADIALTHHERWAGGGYPHGLQEEDIPLAGRITAVADVFDTLTHERPWRPAWEVDRALEELHTQSGRQFDPAVVAAFETLDPEHLLAPVAPDRRTA